MMKKFKIMDGNEAAAFIAYKTNEVCAIYPITPSSAMGEHCDEWSAAGEKNVFGEVPIVVEMQSEAGAAGAIHGALQGGTLASTFTCSQGLLLMIPNMFKIAGELSPAVFHIAARTLATHALSIFSDHSDVMSVRSTGWAMLFGRNSQEAMDMALISQSATLSSRIPFLNIFDGFRTSHELTKTELISDEVILKMLNQNDIDAHRKRGISPDQPNIRGTAQNPDVFFQNREANTPYYEKLPGIVENAFEKFNQLTGRNYKPFEYFGHPEAENIIIIMGSAAGTVNETIDKLIEKGEKIGYVNVRLFRPFSTSHLIESIPLSVKKIAVLDRCKEPGSIGDPLFMDVVNAFNDMDREMPKIIGGRYGLGSKEFIPAMVKAIFDELKKEIPKKRFTIGINDDVSHSSLDYDTSFSLEDQHSFRGLFFGLGADGTVSANKNSIKIIGDSTDNFVQGYFVYDSKKSGSLTVSHLRFGKNPIDSTYLITNANFVACHHFSFLGKYDVLSNVGEGATFLLNSPYSANEVWDKLTKTVQEQIVSKKLDFYVLNASKIARETGMGNRVNTILQTCFFTISGIIPKEEAITQIKKAVEETYSAKGDVVIQKNYNAVDKAVEGLEQVDYSEYIIGNKPTDKVIKGEASDFVKNVLGKIIEGLGDELPVSAFPIDGTFPVATTKFEKRNIADIVPVWDEELCSQCGKCFLICPHAAIRCKVYDKEHITGAPETFKHAPPIGKEFSKETELYTLQVGVEDCTGCRICVEYCPIESKTEKGHKAINMQEQMPLVEKERDNWDFFLSLPETDLEKVNKNTVKGTQLLQPLFEFSGACSGCGETPYVKLLSQLYGDRMLVANATGCSSIYGGNLPTTPWAVNSEGKGPAWANSLFEDNAEFGMGMKLASEKRKETAINLLKNSSHLFDEVLVDALILNAETMQQNTQKQQKLVNELKNKLNGMHAPELDQLKLFADDLVKKSQWIIGGDGWAYDIGFGGVDHVLASGLDINILVLDTEVYSNTGGQKSKATPIGASAKFSVNGKTNGKKDMALQAIAHGSAYVAQIAMGSNDTHAIRTIQEAEAFPGPSIVIAYSHCIAHGYDMAFGAQQQVNAVKSGYWPLFRYNPLKPKGEVFSLDSKEPTVDLQDFMYNENRFAIIKKEQPEQAEKLLISAKKELAARWDRLMALKGL